MYSEQRRDIEQPIVDVTEEVRQRISEHRNWYRTQGIVFILLGISALVMPYATALAINLILGVALTIAGLFQLYSALKTSHKLAPGLSGLLALITGVLLLTFPLSGTIAVGTLIAVFLLLEGIIEAATATSFRPFQGWLWLLFSGFLSILLAILVIAGWPSMTLLFYGVVIGINLILLGISLLTLTKQSET